MSKYGVVALSEGLRKALAPRKIGVSVLCPGVVRTQIFNFRRNVPQRIVEKIGSPPTEGPIADIIKALQERINKFGIDPLYVGELWFARQSKMTGPTSSPTPSTKPRSTGASPRSSRASTASAEGRRGASLSQYEYAAWFQVHRSPGEDQSR